MAYVTLSEQEITRVRKSYQQNPPAFCKHAGASEPTVARAIAGLRILETIRKSLLDATSKALPPQTRAPRKRRASKSVES